MKLASEGLENNVEMKRLNKGCLHGVLTVGRREHMEPGKPFHVRENRKGSKEPSSESEIGRNGGKEVKTWSISKSDWGNRQRAGWRRPESCRSRLASRRPGWSGKGEAGSIPPEQRGLMAPHPQAPKEMLIGRRGTCPFYNFMLFTTSMKFFKNIHMMLWERSQGCFKFGCPSVHAMGCWYSPERGNHSGFFGFSLQKGPRKGAPGIQAEQRGISYVHWFLPQREGLYFFTTRVHQVFYDPTGFLCPKMEIQTLQVQRVGPGYKSEVCLASPKYSFGIRIEIILSSTKYFCESRKCSTITIQWSFSLAGASSPVAHGSL